MDFRNGQELLELCHKENISISEAMKTREITCGTLTSEEIDKKLKTVLTADAAETFHGRPDRRRS